MPYNRYQPFQFKGRMWDPAQSDQKFQIQRTFVTTCLPIMSPMFGRVISFPRISRGPSHHKSGSFNSKYGYHSTSQSTGENQLPMCEPLPSPRQSHSQNNPKALPGPRPSFWAASTVAPAEISCSTTAAWPFSAASCSAVLPRRRGSHGMFLQVVGKNSEYRS